VAKEQAGEAQRAQGAAGSGLTVRFVPQGALEAVFANITTIQPARGVALIDFGLIEPSAVNAITEMARSGKKMPNRMDVRLSSRVALGYDALAKLHQQIGAVLQAVSNVRAPSQGKKQS
jgi:hypothetical protein